MHRNLLQVAQTSDKHQVDQTEEIAGATKKIKTVKYPFEAVTTFEGLRTMLKYLTVSTTLKMSVKRSRKMPKRCHNQNTGSNFALVLCQNENLGKYN